MNDINSFRGEYYFLSNFYPTTIIYNNIKYTNAEAAYQSMKTEDKNIRKSFSNLNGSQAKFKGKDLRIRSNWELIKEQVMYEVCLEKFKQNEDLKIKLFNTGDCYIEECNTWNDIEWGVCNGIGKNKLGIILMRIRSELK